MSFDYRKIPPHTIPTKDKFREVQIPLYDQVDRRPPPPGWTPDGTREDEAPKKTPRDPYERHLDF